VALTNIAYKTEVATS